ncbi:MAG TPA: ABC transporter substrate-binding protein [Aliidongia sp.]|nr:ABC transporter substrate-binding protein [Aliidongia sp.]
MRIIGFIAAALLAGLAATGAQAEDLSKVTLRMADQKGGSRALLEAAGELKDVPYKIEWSEFPAAAPLLEALNAGAADGGPVGDAPLVFALAAQAPVRPIAVNRSDPFGTAILGRPDSPLDGAASLKGKRIGTNKGSIGHFIALAALADAGLKPTDVTFAFLPPVDAKTALASGSIDAWATWEPYTALAQVADHDKVIVNGRGLWSGLSYQVATVEAIRTKHAALQDYVERLRRAQRWANEHVDLYAASLAQIVGIPPEAAKLAFERRHTEWIAIDDSVVAAEQHVVDTYAAARVIPTRFEVAPDFDRSFSLTE